MYHYFLGPCCLVDHYRSIRVVSKYCLGLQSSWSFSSLKSHTKAQCTDVVFSNEAKANIGVPFYSDSIGTEKKNMKAHL